MALGPSLCLNDQALCNGSVAKGSLSECPCSPLLRMPLLARVAYPAS